VQRDEALLAYQQTILQSLHDVSDALITYQRDRDFRAQQELLARAAREALRLTTVRYEGGASRPRVLDADTRLFVAQLGLAQGQAERAARVVANLPLARRRLGSKMKPVDRCAHTADSGRVR